MKAKKQVLGVYPQRLGETAVNIEEVFTTRSNRRAGGDIFVRDQYTDQLVKYTTAPKPKNEKFQTEILVRMKPKKRRTAAQSTNGGAENGARRVGKPPKVGGAQKKATKETVRKVAQRRTLSIEEMPAPENHPLPDALVKWLSPTKIFPFLASLNSSGLRTVNSSADNDVEMEDAMAQPEDHPLPEALIEWLSPSNIFSFLASGNAQASEDEEPFTGNMSNRCSNSTSIFNASTSTSASADVAENVSADNDVEMEDVESTHHADTEEEIPMEVDVQEEEDEEDQDDEVIIIDSSDESRSSSPSVGTIVLSDDDELVETFATVESHLPLCVYRYRPSNPLVDELFFCLKHLDCFHRHLEDDLLRALELADADEITRLKEDTAENKLEMFYYFELLPALQNLKDCQDDPGDQNWEIEEKEEYPDCFVEFPAQSRPAIFPYQIRKRDEIAEKVKIQPNILPPNLPMNPLLFNPAFAPLFNPAFRLFPNLLNFQMNLPIPPPPFTFPQPTNNLPQIFNIFNQPLFVPPPTIPPPTFTPPVIPPPTVPPRTVPLPTFTPLAFPLFTQPPYFQ